MPPSKQLSSEDPVKGANLQDVDCKVKDQEDPTNFCFEQRDTLPVLD